MKGDVEQPSAAALAALVGAPPQAVPPPLSSVAAGAGPREVARWSDRTRILAALAVLVLIIAGTITGAMRRTSTTFDEIVLVAGGARGYETGRFDLAPEHPPLMQYVYGLPVFLAGPSYPVEAEATPPDFGYRYTYAREFFWRSGNDPERLAFLGRLMAVLCAVLLVLVTYGFAAPRIGRPPALLAALLVGLLPDVLAHGGVAYNDVPLALAFVASVWAFDAAARRPSWRNGAAAGLLLAIALGVKFSAVTLLPIAGLVVGAEAMVRRGERDWSRAVAVATCAGMAATYLGLVLIYRGDFALAEFRYGLEYTFQHVERGHGAPGYLLNRSSPTGWWYFFPVAFLFKTPAALHVLAVLAAYGLVLWLGALRAAAGSVSLGRSVHALLGSPLRAAVAGVLVFGAALLSSSLVIGFRYALPLLPLVCILIAAGVAAVWRSAAPRLRVALAVLVMLYAASSLSYYPHFLAYISEYGPGRDRGDLVLLDSSLDWGQGLLELREFMREEGFDSVYLSYFGSADPMGYGIEYLPLPSFFPLDPPQPTEEAAPSAQWVAISATNLHGVYLAGDPLAQFRALTPDRVLAKSLFLYRIDD